jgi:hypothetical protein
VRIAYDRGTLEIMSPSQLHELVKKLLGRMVDTPLESLAVGNEVTFRPLVSGGQTLIGFAPRSSSR